MSEWIKVDDRLPNEDDYPITVCQYIDGDFNYVDSGFRDFIFRNGGNRITHWMPLPEPPK